MSLDDKLTQSPTQNIGLNIPIPCISKNQGRNCPYALLIEWQGTEEYICRERGQTEIPRYKPEMSLNIHHYDLLTQKTPNKILH